MAPRDLLLVVALVGPTSAALSPAAASELATRLKDIVDDRAKHYGCKIAVGMQTADEALAASSDGDASSDLFVWGSITKLLTGSGILRAVEKGKLELDKPVHKLLDPILSALNLGSMHSLFGPTSYLVTPKHLGSMQSGVPDYDTAKPWPKPPMDPFRAMVYADPEREWNPADILNVSWVATGKLEFFPGHYTQYSSTNFVLLGLLLAALDPSAQHWDDYDQRSALDALPEARRQLYHRTKFAVHGSPSDAGAVHGYDRTSYNGQNASTRPGHSVYAVKGVYGGWTASDITAPVGDVARLAYDIFGKKGPRLLSPQSVQTMLPVAKAGKHHFPYGFATFNLTFRGWGQPLRAANVAYGHLGATYGYQSIVAYFPFFDVSVSVASTIETDEQVQPSDVLCLAYNAIVAAITNATQPTCEFVQSGYYGGHCKCDRGEGFEGANLMVEESAAWPWARPAAA